jgi:hypothetical protein
MVKRRTLSDSPFDTLEKNFGILCSGPDTSGSRRDEVRGPSRSSHRPRRAQCNPAAPVGAPRATQSVIGELVAEPSTSVVGWSVWLVCCFLDCAARFGRSPGSGGRTTTKPSSREPLPTPSSVRVLTDWYRRGCTDGRGASRMPDVRVSRCRAPRAPSFQDTAKR